MLKSKFKDVLIDVLGNVEIIEDGTCMNNNYLYLGARYSNRIELGSITDELIDKLIKGDFDKKKVISIILELAKHEFNTASVSFRTYENLVTIEELETTAQCLFCIERKDFEADVLISRLRDIGMLFDKKPETETEILGIIWTMQEHSDITIEYLKEIGIISQGTKKLNVFK